MEAEVLGSIDETNEQPIESQQKTPKVIDVAITSNVTQPIESQQAVAESFIAPADNVQGVLVEDVFGREV